LSDSRPASQPRQYHILNLEPRGYCSEARNILGHLGAVSEGPLSRRELLERISAYDVLIVRLQHHIDRDVFEAGKNLKAIVSATTGLDHIDLESARARNVAVLSLRGEEAFLRTITATAEHTWGLLLAVMRRIPEACEAVRAGTWDRDALRGHDLAGKRLGIVGLGRLGKQVAVYGSAFGMHVSAYDPHVTDWPSTVARQRSLPELFGQSDIVTIHVHLTAHTLKLIGEAELTALPRGAVLVNTSRGQVLDEAAVLDALQDGRLGGAALDVLADERASERCRDNRLINYARSHHNLVITPHIGGATYEAMGKTEVFMVNKLAQFIHRAQA
jgi:D-3-phosphoglycerate dehydrogenase